MKTDLTALRAAYARATPGTFNVNDSCTALAAAFSAMADEIEALRAEVARLRAEFDRIAYPYDSDQMRDKPIDAMQSRMIARAALKGPTDDQ